MSNEGASPRHVSRDVSYDSILKTPLPSIMARMLTRYVANSLLIMWYSFSSRYDTYPHRHRLPRRLQ